jgi:Plavaka transposase
MALLPILQERLKISTCNPLCKPLLAHCILSPGVFTLPVTNQLKSADVGFKLPDHFKDWYGSYAGRPPTASFLAHCKREAFHQQWRLLLSDALIEAMRHGMRIRWADGVDRMFFPRVFTYSADYPEK